MKDTANNGFTLVELLAVIALLALLVTFVVPSAYRYLREGTDKTLSLQEKNVEDAAVLYLEDYCLSPINSNYNCALSKTIVDGFARYSGYISLKTLVDNKYIEEVVFKNQDCKDTSYIEVVENKVKTYLKCGEVQTEGYDASKLNGAI